MGVLAGRLGWHSTADHALGELGVQANSPIAPTRHLPWRDPEKFHESCHRDEVPRNSARMHVADLHAPPQPKIRLTPHPERGVLSINYEIPNAGQAAPNGLVIGLRRNEPSQPTASTLIANPGASGKIEAPLGAGAVEVRAATHSEQGHQRYDSGFCEPRGSLDRSSDTTDATLTLCSRWRCRSS